LNGGTLYATLTGYEGSQYAGNQYLVYADYPKEQSALVLNLQTISDTSQPVTVQTCPAVNVNLTGWQQSFQIGSLTTQNTFNVTSSTPLTVNAECVDQLFFSGGVGNKSKAYFTVRTATPTVKYYDLTTSQFVVEDGVPSDLTDVTGFLNTPIISIPSGDYTIWSISQYLQQINKGLAKCVADCGFDAKIMPPVFTYNYATKVISLNVDTSFNQSGMHVYINDSLQDILRMPIVSSTPTNIYVGDIPTPYKCYDVQLFSVNNPADSESLVGNARYYAISQEGQSLQQLWDLTLIVIRSVSIPVTGDIEASNQLNAITDVSIDVGNFDINADLIYIPYFLRLYTLEQNQPLLQFNIEIWWEDRSGVRHPLYLSPGDQASFKLVFLRH
jgi:hypothetical protein